VTHAQPSAGVKVGILLAGEPTDLAAWLRDAAAFDAAGADALWLDLAPQPDLDPLAVAAALSVVTFRSHLFVSLNEADLASPALAGLLSTIDRLSLGRMRVVADADAMPAEVLSRIGVVRRVPGDPVVLEDTRAEAGQRWRAEPAPDGRPGWQAARLAAHEHGVYGLMVPAGPRLLDLLRNPDDEGDRRDLQLTVG